MMFTCQCLEEVEPGFYREDKRTARKSHTCCECGITITPGQRYVSIAGKGDGKFWSDSMCEICMKIVKEMFPCGYFVGYVWENVHEAHCDAEYCLCPEVE